jgi:hypothetical protein
MLDLRNALFVGAVLLAAAAIFVGRSGQDASQSIGGDPASDAWKAGLDEEVVTALSELSDADRTAALAQKVCPVTDKPLGSMGKPPKVTVEGQEVFLCCDGCEEELKSNPAVYLTKLNTN